MQMAPIHTPGGAMPMTRRRKAALIVQLLLREGDTLQLSQLPEQMQEALALEMGAIRLVDRETVESVAEEFIELLEAIGLSAPGTTSAAIDALSELISPDLATRLRTKFVGPLSGDQWPRILELEVEQLTEILTRESVEVGAVVLSKLPVDKAAAVLSALPGERARRVTFAVSRTAEIPAIAVARIGIAIAQEYIQVKHTAFEKPPVDRVGAILTSSPAATRDDMLASLDEQDEVFARNVRQAIFTFEDLPRRIAPLDIPNILRGVPQEVMPTVMAFALGSEGPMKEAADFILENISQRMAGQMREEADERGKVKRAAGEEALNAFTLAVREQIDSGTISLLNPDEGDEDE